MLRRMALNWLIVLVFVLNPLVIIDLGATNQYTYQKTLPSNVIYFDDFERTGPTDYGLNPWTFFDGVSSMTTISSAEAFQGNHSLLIGSTVVNASSRQKQDSSLVIDDPNLNLNYFGSSFYVLINRGMDNGQGTLFWSSEGYTGPGASATVTECRVRYAYPDAWSIEGADGNFIDVLHHHLPPFDTTTHFKNGWTYVHIVVDVANRMFRSLTVGHDTVELTQYGGNKCFTSTELANMKPGIVRYEPQWLAITSPTSPLAEYLDNLIIENDTPVNTVSSAGFTVSTTYVLLLLLNLASLGGTMIGYPIVRMMYTRAGMTRFYLTSIVIGAIELIIVGIAVFGFR